MAAASLPAAEVGGDYFDHVTLPDGSLGVVIADVAGHGVASGLMLSGVRACLRLLRDDLARPAEVLRRLDDVVREATEPRLLVTLLLAVVSPERRTLRVALAGHPPALVAGADGTVREVGAAAPPLGTRLPSRWSEATVPLSPDDRLLFYSDGLVEARDVDGVPYGEDRLRRELARSGDASARALRDALLDAVGRHKGDVALADDLTLVVVRVVE